MGNRKESVRTTLNNDRVMVMRQEYTKCINNMCTFLQQKYHDNCIAAGGSIQELTEEKKTNPELFYYHTTNTLNLKYEGRKANTGIPCNYKN
jgi:hypothetical protein